MIKNKPRQPIIKCEIFTGSPHYLDALELRYHVFFKPYGLDYEILLDEDEPFSRHFALIESDKVIAYGRLTPKKNQEAQISQLIVQPNKQGRGFGRTLLKWIIDQCERDKTDRIFLSSKISKTNFYEHMGFKCRGKPYPSKKTGLLHIDMVLTLTST